MTTQLKADALDTLAVAMLPLMDTCRAGTISFAQHADGDWLATVVKAAQE